MAEPKNEKLSELENYIMKKCLWQFHSRNWDRKRQNENILGMTKQILLGEPVDTSTPENRCYWVDSVTMAEAFKKNCAWLTDMSKDEIAALMDELYERIEYLTVTGSLNQELTDQHY
ncbi:Fe-only nitrogenase subunit delta [Maridesulfovibrio sp.]|uniref:Fe-only nitrogenase subunit delta n=1 Tax=Maridesulfovibrio sp. TaxID=2795000 RepID=UPI002A18BA68|nr:Fe-only nitrogenase subunit delta [Maridesulfovibrio sp.]